MPGPQAAATFLRLGLYRQTRTGTAALLAAGALERPLVFAGNDLPGVMLAGAARALCVAIVTHARAA